MKIPENVQKAVITLVTALLTWAITLMTTGCGTQRINLQADYSNPDSLSIDLNLR